MHFPVLPVMTQEKSKHFTRGNFQVNSSLIDNRVGLNACNYGEMDDGYQRNDENCNADDHSLYEYSLHLEEQKKENEERMRDNAKEKPLFQRGQGTNSKCNLEEVPCEVCGKKYATHHSVSLHKRISHKEMFPISHDCSICGKNFKSSSTLHAHLEIHSDEKNQCYICGKLVKLRSSLNRHILGHSEEKKFNCSQCGKAFRRHYNAKLHEKSCKGKMHQKFENGKDKLFHCRVCNKGYSKLYLLKCHMGNHSDERPFKCNLCSKSYKFSKSLYAHRKIHVLGKDYACDLCPKKFRFKSSLKNHQQVHDENIHFECDVCGKRFKWLRSLQKHQCVV